MKTHAIVNPNSSGGRTGKNWPETEAKLRAAIGPFEASFTDGMHAATRLTRAAIRGGAEQIVAVGGDGTLNEVVNGFFEDGASKNGTLIDEEVVLGLLMSGTGGDFRKTFGIPREIDGQIDILANKGVRKIDLGKLSFVDNEGRDAVRYFDNIASFGLSGAADQAVNNLTYAKMFGGTFAFQWAIFKTLLRYKNQRVRIRVDDEFDETFNVSTAAVCNGQYFGSGMQMAPDAAPDDGLFDVVVIADMTLGEQIRDSKKIYTGEHLDNPKVTALRGKKVVATAEPGVGDVLLDVDGEAPGRLPATFEILPGILKFRC